MKKSVNKILIAATVLIAAGLFLAIIGVGLGASRSLYLDKNGVHVMTEATKKITETDLDAFTDIEIDAKYCDIEFIPSNKYGFEISYYEQGQTPQWSMDGGKLKIEFTGDNIITFMNFSFSFNKNVVSVYLPEDIYLDNLKVKTGSGDIKIGDFSAKTADIHSSYGNIKLFNAQCDYITVKLSSGDFEGRNLLARGVQFKNSYGNTTFERLSSDTLSVEMSSGDLKLLTCDTGSAAIKSRYGQITARDMISRGMTVEASSGDIKLEGDFSGATEIQARYGNAKLSLNKGRQSYSYDISTKYGNIIIDREKAEGSVRNMNNSENSLKINASSGDIEVSFGRD